jgi:hypothetical protein
MITFRESKDGGVFVSPLALQPRSTTRRVLPNFADRAVRWGGLKSGSRGTRISS